MQWQCEAKTGTRWRRLPSHARPRWSPHDTLGVGGQSSLGDHAPQRRPVVMLATSILGPVLAGFFASLLVAGAHGVVHQVA